MLINKEAKQIIKFLDDLSWELKIVEIVTDNGREFINAKVKGLLKENTILHRKIVPYYHDGNGHVERVNRTLSTALKKEKEPYILRLK